MILSPFILYNSSLTGILISCISLLIFPYIRNMWILILSSSLIVFINIYLGSRAGCFSFFAGTFIFIYSKGFHKNFGKKGLYILASSFILCAACIVFFVKNNSTSGRLFIWQNCFRVLKDNWLAGSGWGTYRVSYNQMQAQWFRVHGFQTKEALLADTVYYAFNEWLQFVIELGIPLAIVLAGTCFFILISAIQKLKTASGFQTGAIASFSGLFMSSFISYPFYYLPTLFLFLFLFFYILCFLWGNKVTVALRYFIISLVVMCLLVYGSFQSYARVRWKEASELTRVAYHLKAKEKLLAAYPVLKRNGDFLFSLGLAYSTINQKDSAVYYLNRSAAFKNDYELHRKLGELYFEQSNFEKAEEHFLIAVYMVPNRFRSRELLVDFYIKTGKKAKAFYWAESSLLFPVKVPSERVTQIRNRFTVFLKTGTW